MNKIETKKKDAQKRASSKKASKKRPSENPTINPNNIAGLTIGGSFFSTGELGITNQEFGLEKEQNGNKLFHSFTESVNHDKEIISRIFTIELQNEIVKLKMSIYEILYEDVEIKNIEVIGLIVINFVEDAIFSRLTSKNIKKYDIKYEKKYKQFAPEFREDKLIKRILAVMKLMKSSNDWPKFYQKLNKKYPQYEEAITHEG